MADNTDDLIISISTDQATLRRSIARIERDLSGLSGNIQKQFAKVGTTIDQSVTSSMQNRINAMVGMGTKASKEWTGVLADQGKELERLRARYSPLFNTINTYKQNITEIRRAHSLGAISSNEYQAAMARERQSALAATVAIKGRNAALVDTPSGVRRAGENGFQTANIAAQFQDIGVTAAMGMSPIQVALQQGTQLSAVLTEMKNPVQGLAAAFMSVVSPVSLITIGVIAAGVAATQYFMGVLSGSNDAAEKLKEQAQLIQAVAEKWGDAVPALRDYANQLQRAQDAADLKQGVSLINEQTLAKVKTQIEDASISVGDLITQLQAAGEESDVMMGLQQAFRQFAEAARDGKLETEDVERVQKALAAAIESSGIPALSEFAKFFDTLSTAALSAAENVQKANDAVSRSQDPSTWRSYDPSKRRLGLDGQNPDGEIRNPGFGDIANPPVPESRPKIELEGLPAAQKKAETAAQKAANAYRDLKKSADDRISQVQQEIDLLGKFGVEADSARFALDLLQRAEDKGRSLSSEQRAELEKKVTLYKQYSETLAKAKLAQDLMLDQRMAAMSEEDRRITTTLRQYGLSEDLNSQQANDIRGSIRRETAREELNTFFGDFKTSLLNNGGDIGKAFGEAIQNALMNQASKLWDKIFDQLTNAILGSSGGASGATGTGGGLGAIIGAVGGRSSSSGSGGAGSAVSLASGLLGQSETSNPASINAFLKKGGVDIDAAQTAWCAGFVNSALAQVGLTGSGSLTANSFQNWGSGVDLSEVMRGDVLLQSRGLGANQAGGHVGLATGASRAGANGLQLQMLSGNSSDSVMTTWVDAAQLQARRATDAAGALESLASSSGLATDGLGKLGQLSTSFFPAAPAAGGGGGGGFGWLSSLFSGITAADRAKYTPLTGLFANGTSFAPGGMALVGEQGPELVNLPQGSQVIPNGKSKQLLAPKAPQLSPRSSTQTVKNESSLVVQIQGANGDDHVRMLVQRGVGEALALHDEQQRRGGFGSMQASYVNRKG